MTVNVKSTAATRLIIFGILCLPFVGLQAQPCTLPIQFNNIQIGPAVCAGTHATLVGTVPTGGNGVYAYQWEMNLLNCGNVGFVPIPGATARDYAVPTTASDNICYRRAVVSGTCPIDYSNKLSVAISDRTNPAPPVTSKIQPSCSTPTGTITITSPAPVNGITYSINGTTYTNTTGIFAGLAPGTYSVTARFISGCVSPVNQDTINPLPVLTGTVSPASANICTGGTTVLTATGGVTYQWYRNGLLIPGATASTYTANQAGSYTAALFNGACSGVTSNAATVTVVSPPSGFISPATAHLCAGGSAVLTISSGTSYQWIKDGTPISGATGTTYTATQAGTYSVTINNSGCSAPSSNNAVVTQSAAITFSVTNTQPNCTNTTGSITVNNAAGGSGSGFAYSRDNGVNFQTSNVFSALAPGTYQIVVRDGAGCKSNATPVVINTFTSTLSATATTTNITCSQSSGSATVTAAGGTPPYTYSLNGGTAQTSNTLNNLPLGLHRVLVRDAASCSFEVSFTIIQVASTLGATVDKTDANCVVNTGSVTVRGSGGVPPYSYRLDNAAYQSANTFTGITVGPHKVTVRDGAGCTFEVPFEIRLIENFPTLVITNPPNICPNTTASLRSPAITAGSDTGLVYTYWVDANATTLLLNPGAVIPGTYFIKATNPAGCFTIKPVIVGQISVVPGTIAVSGPTLACAGDTVTLTASTGFGYQWYRNDTLIAGANFQTYKPKVSGRYSVAINNNVCIVFASNTVIMQIIPGCTSIRDATVLVPTGFTPNRNGVNDVLRPLLYNIDKLRYFRVYNRWGQLVYETAEKGKGWDGTLKGVRQPSETYSWIVEATGFNGDVVKQSGRTVLIR